MARNPSLVTATLSPGVAGRLIDLASRRGHQVGRVGGRAGPPRKIETAILILLEDQLELQRLRARKPERDREFARRVLRATSGWNAELHPWESPARPEGLKQALRREFPKDGSTALQGEAVRGLRGELIYAAKKGEGVLQGSTIANQEIPRLLYLGQSAGIHVLEEFDK